MRGKIESEASVLLRSHSSSKLPIPRISNSKNTSSMTTPGNFLNGEGVVIKPTSGKVTPHSATTTPTPVFVDEANSIKRYLDKLRSHIANTNWCVVENPHTIVLQGVGDVRYVFPRTPETARDILCCCTLQDFSVESFIASLVDSVIPAHILAAGRAITTPPAYTRLPCCVFAIHAIVLL